eukprot:1356812-Rhodomonas_salina.1
MSVVLLRTDITSTASPTPRRQQVCTSLEEIDSQGRRNALSQLCLAPSFELSGHLSDGLAIRQALHLDQLPRHTPGCIMHGRLCQIQVPQTIACAASGFRRQRLPELTERRQPVHEEPTAKAFGARCTTFLPPSLTPSPMPPKTSARGHDASVSDDRR